MRFDTSQQMRLGQQMKLAPRMIQSMEILQMPLAELQERIDQELESNIALEQTEHQADLEGPPDREAERDETVGERELVVGEDTRSGAEDFERLTSMEESYSEAFDNEYSSAGYSAARHGGERDGKMDAMANVAARGESLAEQLEHQWTFTEVDPELIEPGRLIISYIDDDGFLGADLETILEQNQHRPDLTIDLPMLERALHAVQHHLDPAGIGARNRRESLLLQIERIEEETDDLHELRLWEDAQRLLADHYEDLLQNRLPKIAQSTDLSMERIQEVISILRRLHLRPGRELVVEEVRPIIPDVVIEYDEEREEYTARLSTDLLPSLRISPDYAKMAKDRNEEKTTREFVSDNVRRASWLIDAIQQRKQTLLRVVAVVLARQREFFDNGPQHLKPMPMIDVADQLGIHVATVSRAVAEKWMQTPRGLVPLRKFFSGGTSTESGEEMSWEAVKETLREIIDQEDKGRPLSDEAVARALKERGIDLARRTVVKYRQQLDIPPARRRKIHS